MQENDRLTQDFDGLLNNLNDKVGALNTAMNDRIDINRNTYTTNSSNNRVNNKKNKNAYNKYNPYYNPYYNTDDGNDKYDNIIIITTLITATLLSPIP